MAPGPVTSWEIDGETAETVKDFIFLGSQITADGDCSHKDKATVFPVVMYGCWTINKVEHQRIDAFELWCWRTLESPLDCKEIQPVNPKGN